MKDFKVISEAEDSYHIKHKNGRSFTVEKKGLSPKAHEEIQKLCMGEGVQKFNSGGGVEAGPLTVTTNGAEMPDWGMQPHVAPAIEESVVGKYPPIVEPVAPENSAFNAPAAQSPATPAPNDPLVQSKLDTEGVLNKQEHDVGKLQKTLDSSSAQQQGAYQDFINQQANMRTPEQIQKEYEAKDAQLMNGFMSQKIDPDRYVHNMSTGSKILAGIGLALASVGGPAGVNAALGSINNSINHDIEAQKNAQGKAMTLWKMNREHMKDDQQATLMTQNQMLSALQAKVAMAGSNVQNADARLRASQMVSQIEQQKIANRQRLGLLTQGVAGGSSQADPTALLQGIEAPPEHIKKALDEVEASQNTTANMPAIMTSFENAAKNIHGVDFVPGIQNADQKSLHALLGPTFKDVEGTVRQAAMDNLFQNITPQFGDTKETVDKKRDALRGYMESKKSAPTFRYLTGVPLSNFSSTASGGPAGLNPQQQRIYQIAKANPNDPASAIALKKLGVR